MLRQIHAKIDCFMTDLTIPLPPGVFWPLKGTAKKLAMRMLALISVCFLTGCFLIEEYTYHQKLTIKIETPEGVVTASSVIRFHHDFYPHGAPLMSNERSSRVEGEAVVADLGEGRFLFALLPDTSPIAYSAFDDLRTRGTGSLLKALTEHAGQPPRPVPGRYWPQFITYKNTADLHSVVEVEPSDLSKVFGDGFSILEVSVQIVDTPVTVGRVQTVLPWMSDPSTRKNPFWASLPYRQQKAIRNLIKLPPKERP